MQTQMFYSEEQHEYTGFMGRFGIDRMAVERVGAYIHTVKFYFNGSSEPFTLEDFVPNAKIVSEFEAILT